MPGDSQEAPPQITQDLINFCMVKNWKLLIGTDSNAHNTAWGCADNNNRGNNLLEYLMTTNLEVCNIGTVPTFVCNDEI